MGSKLNDITRRIKIERTKYGCYLYRPSKYEKNKRRHQQLYSARLFSTPLGLSKYGIKMAPKRHTYTT